MHTPPTYVAILCLPLYIVRGGQEVGWGEIPFLPLRSNYG